MANLYNLCDTTVIPSTNSFLTKCNLYQKNIFLKCTDLSLKSSKFLSSNTNDDITWTCLSYLSENRENINMRFEDINEKLSSLESSLSNLAGTSVAYSKLPSCS